MNMPELTVGPQRPVQSAAPVAQTYSSPEAKRTPDAPAAERRDVMELSGKGQSARELTSAEQVFGKLHEMGLLESASRPLPEEAVPPDAEHAATLTIRLDSGEEQAAEAPAEAVEETEEEWQPYQPPSAVQSPPTVSEDGQSVTLYLFQTGDGAELFFEMDGIFLPLNADGALLAGLLDGSFRMLTFNMDMLELLLGTGQATLDLLLGAELDMLDLPDAPGDYVPSPVPQPAATPGETAEEPVTEKSAETAAPARPEAAEAPREKAPAAQTQRPEGPLAVKTEVPPPDGRAENVGTWAAMRAVERSFEDMAQRWMTDFPDRSSPEALTRWDGMQREWVSNLEQNAPATFRAWLEVHVGRDASDGVLEKALLPEGFTRADYERWMASDILSYEEKTGVDSGVQWLLTQIVRLMLPEERERIVSQSGWYAAGEAVLHSGEDDKSLARRLPEIMAQILSGSFRAATADHVRDMDLPPYPQRGEDERERAWKRRQIAYEVDSDWTANLKQWLVEVDGWRISRSRDYVNGKANIWSTDLMNGRPAQFRQWLSSPVRYAASTGWFNRATGSFPINTLPEGFTDDDLRRWLLRDTLDYL